MSLIPLSDLSIFSFITTWSLLPSVLLKLELGEGEALCTTSPSSKWVIWRLDGRGDSLFCVSICPAYLKLSACFSLLALPNCFSLGIYPISCFLKASVLTTLTAIFLCCSLSPLFWRRPQGKVARNGSPVSFNINTIAVHFCSLNHNPL